MNQDWSVESLHANCGVGDCALHVLKSSANAVESVVLVDGGATSSSSIFKESNLHKSPVTRLLELLKNKNYAYKAGSLQLDTIVITHWDDDHYAGLADALRSEWTDTGVSWLKPNFGTKLYCPNVTSSEKNYKLNGIEVTGGPKTSQMKHANRWFRVNLDDPNYVDLKLKGNDWVRFASLLVAERNKWDVLGVDFFSNNGLNHQQSDYEYPSDFRLAQLIGFNPPRETGGDVSDGPTPGRPGMYAIGVLRRSLRPWKSGDPLPTTWPPSNPNSTVLAMDETEQPVGVVPDEHVTLTNKWSIAAAIIWADEEIPRCSHYFAGDADEESEKIWLSWLTQSGIQGIRSIKLSHHGSRSSTPLSFLTDFMPLNIVMSTPASKYFHPAWETVLYVAAAHSLYPTNLKPLMLATKWPFYFTLEKGDSGLRYAWVNRYDGPNQLSTASFDGSKEAEPFRDFLDKRSKSMGALFGDKTAKNELTIYMETKKRDEKRMILLHMTAWRWLEYGFPGANWSEPSLSTFPTAAKSEVVLAIQITSVANPDLDGHVSYSIVASTQEFPVRDPNIQASNEQVNLAFLKQGKWEGSDAQLQADPQYLGALPVTDVDGKIDWNLQSYNLAPSWMKWPNGSNPDEGWVPNPDSWWDANANSSTTKSELKGSSLGLPLPEPGPVIPGEPDAGDGRPPSDGWYFCHREIRSRVEVYAQEACASPTSPMWNHFVKSLHTGLISLPKSPEESPGDTLLFHENDELVYWFKMAVGAGDLSVKSTSAEGDFIGGFGFDMPLNPQSGQSVVLSMSTEATLLAKTFGFTDVPSLQAAGMGDGGLTSGSTALVFALGAVLAPRTDGPPSITLSDVAIFAGFPDLFSSSTLLNAFSSLELQFPNLDTKPLNTPCRNAVWFVPQAAYRTTARLELELLPSAIDTVNGIFHDAFNSVFQLTSCSVIARKDCRWALNTKQVGGFRSEPLGSLVLLASWNLDLGGKNWPFSGTIEFLGTCLRLSLTLNFKSTDALEDICNWFAKITGLQSSDFDIASWLKNSGGAADKISFPDWQFRRVTLAFGIKKDPNTMVEKLSFSFIAIDTELHLQVNKGDSAKEKDLLFLLKYTYTAGGEPFLKSSILEADLWFEPDFDPTDQKLLLLPDYESYVYLDPITVKGLKDCLDLKNFNGLEDLPSWVPTQVTRASLFLFADEIGFGGTIVCRPPDPKEKIPVFQIDELDLELVYSKANGVGVSFAVAAMLQPAPNTKNPFPAQLSGKLEYNNKSWELGASVCDLTGSTICQLFENDMRITVGRLLESVVLRYLNITYHYGDDRKLIVDGILILGAFELTVGYTNSGDSKWVFSATVEPSETNNANTTTVGQIIEDLIGENPLPAFASDIFIGFNPTKDRIGFCMASTHVSDTLAAADAEKQLFATAYLNVGGLVTQYIMLRSLDTAKDLSKTKHIFYTALQSLPSLNVPVLGDITQPFDEVLFLYVGDDDGIAREELLIVNTMVSDEKINQKPIPFKETKKPNQQKPKDILLTPGLHLMLVLKDDKGGAQCVLDYQFKQKEKSQGLLLDADMAESDDASDNKPSGMTSYPKKFGPLAVQNLGFNYGNDVLSIKVDAQIVLGPITFEMLGFSLNMDFNSENPSQMTEGGTIKKWSWQNLPTPKVSLSGLAIGYNKAPITVDGLLLYVDTDKMKMYAGAIAAGFNPWEFSAVGCYGMVDKSGNPMNPDDLNAMANAFKTVFLFCVLHGPLVTLAFAEISAVSAGFGYNSHLRLPNAVEVPKFPLVGAQFKETDPVNAQMALFKSPAQWITPQENSYWIAAGLTVKAFKMFNLQALIVVEWDPSVKLGLFGIASAAIPFSPDSSIKFAYVELAVAAVIDFDSGTMKIDGQLTPASFILDPDCHLTGGFALYSWFGGETNDWVFTIGGYHNAYKAPPQYPQPPRLAISWDLGPVAVHGAAYFAITPKVCMGGGIWNVSLDAGPLHAFYCAYVDFLINFQPFHFLASGGLAVGVQFTMDLWLVTIHINIDISAQLYVEGPPVHGYVHVNFWVFGFNIKFGDDSEPSPSALKLDEFINLVCQTDLKPSELIQTVTAPIPMADDKAFIFLAEDGLVPSGAQTEENDPWSVRAAHFTFSVTAKFALQKITVVTPNREHPEDPTNVEISGPTDDHRNPIPVNAKPMNLPGPIFKSELTVTIQQASTGLEDSKDNNNPDPIWDQNQAITTMLPSGLWGPYDPKADPSTTSNNAALLDGTKDTTVHLLNGVRISRPQNKEATKDLLQPFNYQAFMIRPLHSEKSIPNFEPDDKSFLPDKPDIAPTGEDGKPTRSSQQWSWVRQAWESPSMGSTALTDAVTMWTDLGLNHMGWDPAKLGGGTEPDLVGTQPINLIADLEERFMRAPLISVAA
ncbi:MAG: hypothetical protein M1822_009966 [Bathelium mastoideum]|nr:MAG: hypothetical protein M1822_009966 [Bathelium mastoideum]